MLTQRAEIIMNSADRVLGTARISELYDKSESLALSDLLKRLEQPFSGTTAVLVGGDCCFFSVAEKIVADFSELYDIEQINGIGSISYFAAEIRTKYDDACLLSLHGRNDRIVSYVSYNKKVFALTGGSVKAHDICGELFHAGLTDVEIVIGENLSYSNERIVQGKPGELKNEHFNDLSVIFIGNENAANPHVPLRDRDFIRSEDVSYHVPMTKEEVRRIMLLKLAPSPKDILYDIGAGTGSTAIEMARCVFEGIVYAIECQNEACQLIEKNRVRHGAYNVIVHRGRAPDCLAELPVPDKAFIGGSSGEIEEIVKLLLEKNPNIRIVVNVVTPQNLSRTLDVFERFQLSDIETICVNIAKSKRVNACDIMVAQNPVYIVSGGG